MPRLFILDAMGLIYRAYYAFIRRPLIDSTGQNTSAIYGIANSLLKIRREESPDLWVMAWDGAGPTHRHARFPQYKATRKPMPGDLVTQMPAIGEMVRALALPVLEIAGLEADDVMATLAVCGAAAGYEVVMVTSDKDMLQLVNDHVRLLSPVGRGEEYAWVDAAAVREKWGVGPHETRDVLALMGDSVDNIPGVKGVGEKTAVELIARFGSLEGLYERLAEVKRPALREKLAGGREAAFLSRELVTVRTDCDLSIDWDAFRLAPIHREAVLDLVRRFELVRLGKVVDELDLAERGPKPASAMPGARGGEGAAEQMVSSGTRAASDARPFARAPAKSQPSAASGDLFQTTQIAVATAGAPAPPLATTSQGALDLWGAAANVSSEVSLDALTTTLHALRARAVDGVALLPVATSDDARRATLAGIALAARDGAALYLPIAHPAGPSVALSQVREWLGPLLADPATPRVAEDLKRDAHLLAAAGIELEFGGAFDVRLGSFLLDPERDHGLEALAADALGMSLPPLEAPAARGRGRPAELPVEIVAPWAEQRARALFPIADALRAQLEAREQWRLYETLEHPLIAVLLDMERHGILLDPAVLAAMSARAAEDIARLEHELETLAGERINLNSGPQLARVLFERLKLKTGRRTKTGFSTDQAVLEELATEHPFPARVLEYRALAKLKSTYLDALPLVVDPRDGRVHTSYNQAGAATGRLSSSNPNLQNIPMRSPLGRAIRRAFVAAPGRTLVGADYSQIELRLMAHLSGDPNLIEAFESGEDVHASTARRIFGITGELDPAIRSRAKIVNFGVMYGMGARSLSQQMGIGLTEAQDFIANYFRVYSRVREFLDGTLEEARRRGWVQTLLGRRRYLPALQDRNGLARSNAERAAINTPIQGSAADLMKLAMIRVHGALKRSHPSATLLLQVHDELVLESPSEIATAVSTLVRTEMVGCFQLRVPLEVSVGQGATWFDVH